MHSRCALSVALFNSTSACLQEANVRYDLGRLLAETVTRHPRPLPRGRAAAKGRRAPGGQQGDKPSFIVKRVLAVRRRTATTYLWLLEWMGCATGLLSSSEAVLLSSRTFAAQCVGPKWPSATSSIADFANVCHMGTLHAEAPQYFGAMLVKALQQQH